VPQTRTENHPEYESELVVACEAGTPAYSLHSEDYTVFPRTQPFCRVSYIGFTAGTRKHRDARNVIHA